MDKPIPQNIVDVAAKYNVKLSRDTYNCNPNQAASTFEDIYLGAFDDDVIELAAFFHELGHIVAFRDFLKSRDGSMSRVSCESLAWEIGFELASQHGYKWDYYSPAMKYGRKCLSTYVLNKDWINELKGD